MGPNIGNFPSFNVSLNHMPIFPVLSQGFQKFFVLLLGPSANFLALDLRILLRNLHGFLIFLLLIILILLKLVGVRGLWWLFFHSVHFRVRLCILTWQLRLRSLRELSEKILVIILLALSCLKHAHGLIRIATLLAYAIRHARVILHSEFVSFLVG